MIRTIRSLALAAVLAIAALTTTGPATAQEQKFIVDQNGCKVVNPFPRAEESITWTGGCDADGFTDGEGVLQWYQSGVADEKYEGEMKHGYAHGKGSQTMVDGSRYEGEWKNSRQEGEGTFYAIDGSIYQGGWKDGKPHGVGMYRTPDGRVMRGEWEDGELKSGAPDGDAEPEDADNPNRT